MQKKERQSWGLLTICHEKEHICVEIHLIRTNKLEDYFEVEKQVTRMREETTYIHTAMMTFIFI